MNMSKIMLGDIFAHYVQIFMQQVLGTLSISFLFRTYWLINSL